MQTDNATCFIAQYEKILYKVISLGLIVFINGFFWFPEVSWIKTSFYLLVLLPSLGLLPIKIKHFPICNKAFLIFIALPCYLCISHLWASEEHISRNFFFFLKQVIFIFALVFSFWIIIRKNDSFLTTLLVSLVVSGAVFSFISIAQHFYVHGNMSTSRALMGFSMNDSNKAAALYTVHLALSSYFLFFSGSIRKTVTAIVLLGLAVALDIVLIILSQSKGAWVTVLLIALFFSLYSIRTRLRFMYLAVLICFFIIFAWYFNLLEMLNTMSSYTIRLKLVEESVSQAKEAYLYGMGLTYKLSIPSEIHSHNLFIDTFRFGGLVALLLMVLQVLSIIWLQVMDQQPKCAFIFFLWLFSGIILLSLYGQQVLTRPGYIWFLYWIPLAILTSSYLNKLESSFFQTTQKGLHPNGQ